jgi:hypothetical protein
MALFEAAISRHAQLNHTWFLTKGHGSHRKLATLLPSVSLLWLPFLLFRRCGNQMSRSIRSRQRYLHVWHLTNRSSQPLAALMTEFDLMKQFLMLAMLAAASGGSAPSR